MNSNKTLFVAGFIAMVWLCSAGSVMSQGTFGKHQLPVLTKPGRTLHKSVEMHFANFSSQPGTLNQSMGKRPGSSLIHVDSITRYSINNGNEMRYSSYDQNCNLLTYLKKIWVIDAWMNSAITENTYDISGHWLTSTNRTWMGNSWLNTQMMTNTYDLFGNVASTTAQNWDGAAWINSEMSSYSYDGNGNRRTNLYQQWDGTAWMNTSLDSITYDPDGNRLDDISFMWDGAAWSYNSKEALTYDADGNLLTDTYMYWDWDLMDWSYNGMMTYTYDENGNCLTYLEQMWDGAEWMNYYMLNLTYDANGNELEYINEYCYDGVTWSYYSKGIFTYDAGNNCLSGIWQQYKNNISDFENDQKVEYSYEWDHVIANGFKWTGSVWMMGDCYFTINLMDNGERHMFWQGDGGAVRVIAYYSYGGVGINENLPGATIRVYPNPASEKLMIELNTDLEQKVSISLTDISGAKVATIFEGMIQPGTKNMVAGIGCLKAGIYFLQCCTPTGNSRQKVCVVR